MRANFGSLELSIRHFHIVKRPGPGTGFALTRQCATTAKADIRKET